MAGYHGPYEFTNATKISYLHGCLEGGKFFRVVGSDHRIEIPKPVCVAWEEGGPIFREWDFIHPCSKIFSAEFVNICMTVNFDVIFCLHHINAVEHVEKPLTFNWHCQLFVEEVHEDVGCVLVWGSDGKVIHLSHEDDAFPVDHSGVEARFVNSRDQPDVTEDGVSVFLP